MQAFIEKYFGAAKWHKQSPAPKEQAQRVAPNSPAESEYDSRKTDEYFSGSARQPESAAAAAAAGHHSGLPPASASRSPSAPRPFPASTSSGEGSRQQDTPQSESGLTCSTQLPSSDALSSTGDEDTSPTSMDDGEDDGNGDRMMVNDDVEENRAAERAGHGISTASESGQSEPVEDITSFNIHRGSSAAMTYPKGIDINSPTKCVLRLEDLDNVRSLMAETDKSSVCEMVWDNKLAFPVRMDCCLRADRFGKDVAPIEFMIMPKKMLVVQLPLSLFDRFRYVMGGERVDEEYRLLIQRWAEKERTERMNTSGNNSSSPPVLDANAIDSLIFRHSQRHSTIEPAIGSRANSLFRIRRCMTFGEARWNSYNYASQMQ